ncbi:DUF418 domain-containing protein [Corynebacterium aquatimens]|uniref:DUF418 domain-containing protein n=1 Tax=Corynebacterium aquatimens TaxID=1190508 RepID=UPI00253FFB1E|nr:DUF418 domain-containing protein [Corynebacterium aquatimens]
MAGISMSLMAAKGATPAHFVVRGALLVALHPLLSLVPTNIYIVLGTLGICMIALAWAPRWDSTWLAALMVPLALLSAAQVIPAMYSPGMWAVLMLAGMLFHRHVLGHATRLVACAVVGLVALAADIAVRWYVPLHWFFDADGHTGGLIDVAGSTGASLGITALCCLVAQPWQRVLPRMGAMPLTLYCLHVVTEPFIGIWPTVLGAAVLATLWLQFFRRGPLEDVLRRVVAAGANTINTFIDKEKTHELEATGGPGAGHGDGGRVDPAAGTRDGEHHVRG